MGTRRTTRRSLLFTGAAAGGLLLAPRAAARRPLDGPGQDPILRPTPENILGPYYRSGAPRTSTLQSAPGLGGLPLRVEGTVKGTGGAGLPEVVLEVWHADPLGHYDPDGFLGRATVPVDREGRYAFTTCLPGHYSTGGAADSEESGRLERKPGSLPSPPVWEQGAVRPQHIHYRATAPAHRELVTQVYFETDPFFDGDPAANLMRDPFVMHRELVVPVQIHPRPAEHPRFTRRWSPNPRPSDPRLTYSLLARFDLVLGPE